MKHVASLNNAGNSQYVQESLLDVLIIIKFLYFVSVADTRNRCNTFFKRPIKDLHAVPEPSLWNLTDHIVAERLWP